MLKITFTCKSKELPLDYRGGFMSIIKGAIYDSSPLLYKLWFEKRTVKPYTFSVSFGDNVKIDGDKIYFDGNIDFKFSTIDKDMMFHLYNHLIKKRKFPFYNSEIEVKDIWIKVPVKIKSSEAVFRTLSPILIRSHKNKDHYLCPKCDESFQGDAEFDEAFKFNIEELVRNLLEKSLSVDVEFKPMKMKRVIVKHMDLKFPSFAGKFYMKADPEILNLINGAGIGSRRSQGFGMVELLSEGKL